MLNKLTWPTVAWPMFAAPILAVTVGISLTACKILPTPTAENGGNAPAFNADKMVADIWAAKVVPYLQQKAGPFSESHALAKADPAAAGAKYGNPKKQANSPWTFAVRLEGKIVAANTQSRAATMDVDADGDRKADARVQIGPAMRGTALRDSLDFIQFNDFTNQIDFAQFGKALNSYADKTVLSKLPRETLEGRSVKIVGAYVMGSGQDLPLVTPAEAEIGPTP
jgi:predicted lipoprotein